MRELRHEEVETLETVSRRSLSCLSASAQNEARWLLHFGVRALAQGGGYTGDCFASSILVRHPRPRTKRVGFRHCKRELWHKETDMLATD